MFKGAKCSRKQNVLGTKVFQEAKCSRDKNVLRIKMFLEAKYESAKCVKKQSVLGSKVCLSHRSCLFADIWRWVISSLFGRAWKEAKIPFWCCYLPSHVPQLKSHGCPREPLTWQLTHHVGDRFEFRDHNWLKYYVFGNRITQAMFLQFLQRYYTYKMTLNWLWGGQQSPQTQLTVLLYMKYLCLECSSLGVFFPFK